MNSLLEKNLISTKDASALSGYNPDYLARLCRSGKINGTRVGRAWLVSQESLEAFVKEQGVRKQELRSTLSEIRGKEYHRASASDNAINNHSVILDNAAERGSGKPTGTANGSQKYTPFQQRALAVLAALVVMLIGVYGAQAQGLGRIGNATLSTALTIADGFDTIIGNGIQYADGQAAREVAEAPASSVNPATANSIQAAAASTEQIAIARQLATAISSIAPAASITSAVPAVTAQPMQTPMQTSMQTPPQENLASDAGEVGLSIGVGMRDSINAIPRFLAVNEAGGAIAFSNFSDDILRTYANGVYAWVDETPVVPAFITWHAYDAGMRIADAAGAAPRIALAAFNTGVNAWVVATPQVATAIIKGEIALGTPINDLTDQSLSIEESGVKTTGYLAYEQAARGSQTLAEVPSALAYAGTVAGQADARVQDFALGFAGNASVNGAQAPGAIANASGALAAAIIPAPAYNAGRQIALFTYHSINDLFSQAGGVLAFLFGDHGTHSNLAVEPTMYVIPPTGAPVAGYAIPKTPSPVAISSVSSGPVARSTQNIQNITNQTIMQGASQDYVDDAITNLRNMILRQTDTIVDQGSNSYGGLTSTSGGFNSLTVSGNTALNGLSAATSTFNGPVTVSGDLSVSGTLSPAITSTTDLTATNATFTNATTTNGIFTNATTTNAYVTDLASDNSTITNLLATSATTTDFVSTNATVTDAAFTNATSTNFYATALGAGTATLGSLLTTGNAVINGTLNAATTSLSALTVGGDAAITGNANVGSLTVGTLNGFLKATAGAISTSLIDLTSDISGILPVGNGGTGTSSFAINGVLYGNGTNDLLTTTQGGANTVLVADNGAPSFSSAIDVGTSITTPNVYATTAIGIGTTSPGYALGVSGDAYISGNLTIGDNLSIGSGSVVVGSASSTVAINGFINSDLVPQENDTYNLGSPALYWDNGYIDTLNVNNFSAASTTIGGTSDADFVINSANSTVDTEDMSLIFFRGKVNPNAVLSWNSTDKRFEFNQAAYIENQSSTTTEPTFTLQAAAGQTGDVFDAFGASGASLFDIAVNGNIGIGTSTPDTTLAVAGSGLFSGDLGVANLTATGTATVGGLSIGSLNGVLQATSGVVSAATTGNVTDGTDGVLSFTGGTGAVLGSGLQITVSQASSLGSGFLSSSDWNTFNNKVSSSRNINTTYPLQGGGNLGSDLTLTLAFGTSTSNTWGGTQTFTNAPILGSLSGLIYGTSGTLAAATVSSPLSFTGGALSLGTVGIANGGTGTTTGGVTNGVEYYNGSTLTNGSGFVYSGGNVGIGTTSPWAQLSINPNGVTGPAFAIGSSTATNFVVTNGGQVGIGTANPAANLDIHGGSTVDGLRVALSGQLPYLAQFYNTSYSNTSAVFQYFGYNTGDFRMGNPNSQSVGIYAGSSSGYSSPQIIIKSNGDVGIGGSAGNGGNTFNAPTLVALANGNVGIGTTSPSQALSVQGNGLFSGNLAVANFIATGTAKIGSLSGVLYGNSGTLTSVATSSISDGPDGILTITGNGTVVGSGGATITVSQASSLNSGFLSSADWNTFNNKQAALTTGLGLTLAGGNLTIATSSLYSGTAGQIPYFSATNTLTATSSLFLASNGNVGIGTTTPANKLDVYGNIGIGTAGSGGYIYGDTQTTYLRLSNSVGTILGYGNSYIEAGGSIIFDTNNTTQGGFNTNGGLYVGTSYVNANVGNGNAEISGTVGIGTTSPFAKLSVNGSAGGTTPLFAVASSTSGYATSTVLEVNQNGNLLAGLNGASVGIGTTSPWAQLSVNPNGISGPAFVIGSSTATDFIVSNGGNVGIGTTTPNAPLTVNGTGLVGAFGSSTFSNQYIKVRNNNGLGEATFGLNAATYGSDLGYAEIEGGQAKGIGFVTGNDAFATTPSVYLTSAGNFGIGTTTPQALLDVGGQAGPQAPFVSGPTPVASFSANVNNISGMQLTNTNTGTLADFRFAISDQTGNYTAFSLPSTGNTASSLFGLARNTSTFLFNNGGTTRAMAIGTLGANDLVLGTNGSDRLHITSAGNVGIATTSPFARLSVDTSNLLAGVPEFVVGSSTRTDFLIGQNGNVGIGTTSPFAKLSVNGSAGGTTPLFAVASSTSGYATSTVLEVDQNGNLLAGLNGASVGIGTTSPWAQLSINPNGITGPAFAIGSSTATDFVVTNGGNVGIGYTAPAHALDVKGGVAIGSGAPSATVSTGQLWVNGNAAFGGAAISSNNILSIAENIQDPATFYTAVSAGRNIALTSANAQQMIGVSGIVSLSANAFNDTGTLSGGNFQINNSNLATVSTASGVTGLVYNEGAGTISNAYAGNFSIQNLNAAGVITNAYGAYVGGGFNNSTIHNEYGVYVDTLPAASSTYGFYENSTANNFFSGNVGIGTTSPTSALTVVSGTSPQVKIYDASTQRLTVSFSSSIPYIYGYDDTANNYTDMGLGGAGVNPSIYIKAGGNVGIGTTSPNYALTINASGSSGDVGALITSASAGSTALFLQNTNGGKQWSIKSTGGGAGVGGAKLLFKDETDSLSAMVIDSSGNVGIGTTSPGSLLSIGTTNGINFSTATSTFYSTGGLNLTNGCYAVNGTCIGGSVWTTSGNNIYNANSGFVGIGSTSPTTLLSVGNSVAYGTATSTFATSIVNSGDYFSQPAGNPTFVSATSTGPNGPQSVYVSGRYAYFANSNSFSIFDVSNPASPAKVGFTSTGLSSPRSIYVSGRYAYIADETKGLVIFDISNPANPVEVGSTTTGLSYTQSVSVSGRYAYVADETNGLVIFDISNPASPVKVGSITAGAALSVSVSGRYAYVTDAADGALDVFDISNPANPVQVGSTTTGLSYSPYSVYVSGRYAYVADYYSGLVIFDISNPASPTEVGTLSLGASGGANNVYVSGRYAYVTDNFSASLIVVDISNPASPTEVGTVSTSLSNPESVYVSGRYAYVADYYGHGLVIFDVGGTETNALIANSLEAGNLQVRNDITAQGQLSIGGGLNVGSGGIFSAGPLAVGIASSTQIGAISASFQGRVGIDTSSPNYVLDVGNSSVSGIVASFTNSTGYCTINPTTTSLSCSSDERLKTNFNDISATSSLADIEELSPLMYNWKTEATGTPQHAGFIAQQIQQIFPDLVATGPGGYLTLNYAGFVPYLTAGIQELDQRTAFLANGASPNATSTTLSLDDAANGDLGIKTNTPQHVLDVNGDIGASSYAVEGAGPAFTTQFGTLSINGQSAASALSTNGQNVDLYRLGTYNLASVQYLAQQQIALASTTATLSAQVATLANSVSAIEAQISTSSLAAALQGVSASSTSSTLSDATTTVMNALQDMGVLVEKGIAQFNTLVVRDIVFSKDSDGTSAAGSGSIAPGELSVTITNDHMLASSQISVTLTSSLNGNWYVSNKQDGSFEIFLSQTQDQAVTFDYLIIQTQGQIATSTPIGPQNEGSFSFSSWLASLFGGPASSTNSSSSDSGSNSAIEPTPVTGDSSTGSSNPAVNASSTPSADAPVVTLEGGAAISLSLGDVFIDPGATAVDASGTDITSSIVVSGSVDTSTAGIYTLTYTATDGSGNTGSASRVVTVSSGVSAESSTDTSSSSDSDASDASSTPSSVSGSSPDASSTPSSGG